MAHFATESTTHARDFEILSFSWRGSGHRAREEQKQDFCDYRDLGPFGILAVVSDGVGSCPRSREGAESVVRTSLDTIGEAILRGINHFEAAEYHWKAWIATSIERNRRNLAELLTESDSEFPPERKIRELFSATQLLAWTDGRKFVASIVGDGAIIGVQRESNGALRFQNLGDVDRQGMANEVIPVTLQNWQKGWVFRGPEICDSLEGIIVVTDGFSDSAGDSFWSYLWDALANKPLSSPRQPDQLYPIATPLESPPFESVGSAPIPIPPPLPLAKGADPREEFLKAFSGKLESGGYSKDDKTLILIRFH
jgi:hypothetical protein